jgi:DnaJ-class molecular chaperone
MNEEAISLCSHCDEPLNEEGKCIDCPFCHECGEPFDEEPPCHRCDPPMCSSCSGSGEGMYDGQKCGSCKGQGVITYTSTDIEMDRAAQEDAYDLMPRDD